MATKVKKIVRKLDKNSIVLNSQSQRNSEANSPERLPKSARRLVQSLKFGQNSGNNSQRAEQQSNNQQKQSKQQSQAPSAQIYQFKQIQQIKKIKNIQMRPGVNQQQKQAMNSAILLDNKINSSRVITPLAQRNGNAAKQLRISNGQQVQDTNDKIQGNQKVQNSFNSQNLNMKSQIKKERSRNDKSTEDSQNISYQFNNGISINDSSNRKQSFKAQLQKQSKEQQKQQMLSFSHNQSPQLTANNSQQNFQANNNHQQQVTEQSFIHEGNGKTKSLKYNRQNSYGNFNSKNSTPQYQGQNKALTRPQSPDSLSVSIAPGDIRYVSQELSEMQEEQRQMMEYINAYLMKKKQYPPTLPEFYRFEKFIGKGASSKVVLATHKLTGLKVAIKTINKKRMMDEHSRKKVFQEVFILKKIRHRHVIKLYEVFESKKHLMIVMEHASGGDLLNFVRNRKRLTEQESRFILKQLISALASIHDNGVLHRDVKLDNILLNGNFSSVKICDFGVSKITKKGVMIYEHCGTPAYIAPEIIAEKGYEGFSADIWSLGVVAYAMIIGAVPFRAKTLAELQTLILRGKFILPE